MPLHCIFFNSWQCTLNFITNRIHFFTAYLHNLTNIPEMWIQDISRNFGLMFIFFAWFSSVLQLTWILKIVVTLSHVNCLVFCWLNVYAFEKICNRILSIPAACDSWEPKTQSVRPLRGKICSKKVRVIFLWQLFHQEVIKYLPLAMDFLGKM